MRGVHHYTICALMVLFSMLIVHTSSTPTPIMEKCRKISSCSCLTDSGLIIDLSPLDSLNYLQPAFKDIPVTGNSTDKFSWNPCTPFCENHCENAATCQVADPNANLYYTTGQHVYANFSLNYMDKNLNVTGLVVTYIARSILDTNIRRSAIRLLCDESATTDELIAYGETGYQDMQYYFELVSKHACPKKITALSSPLPTKAEIPPPLPTCPRPWITKSTKKTTPTPTTKATTMSTKVTARSTKVTTMSTTAAPSPTPSPFVTLWIAISVLSAVVLLLLVFVIVLMCGRGPSRTIMLPMYDNRGFSGNGTDDTKALIKY